jgi:hypothetical protein
MSLQSAPQFAFEFGGGRPIEVEISKAPLASDAGLLVFRQLDERLRYTEQFAAAMCDTRTDPTHSPLEMLRQRVYGMLADYEDQNDHDTRKRPPQPSAMRSLSSRAGVRRGGRFCERSGLGVRLGGRRGSLPGARRPSGLDAAQRSPSSRPAARRGRI